MGCVKEQPQNEFGPVPARTYPADALEIEDIMLQKVGTTNH